MIGNQLNIECTYCIIRLKFFYILDPFFKESAESWASRTSARILCTFGVLLTFIGILSSSFLLTSTMYMFCFGFICGTLLKIIFITVKVEKVKIQQNLSLNIL